MNGVRVGDLAPVCRGLVRVYWPIFAWFIAVTMAIIAVTAAALAGTGLLDASVWGNTAAGQPRYFLLAMGVLLVSTHLPVYVAHGVTRRVFALAALAFATAVAFAFSVWAMLGFGVEHLILADLGLLGGLAEPYPVQSIGAGLRLMLELTLVDLVYVCCGWLIGSLYYRFGGWTGTLLLPPAVIPVLVAEGGFGEKWLGTVIVAVTGLKPPPYGVGLLIALAAVAVTMAAIHILTRSIPLRPKKA